MISNHKINSKFGPRRYMRRLMLVSATLVLIVLAGCTQGTTGIFADIEQEVEIKTSNLVDNTFAGSIARADTGDGSGERYFVVAGTKLFARSVDDNDWSGVGSPGGHPVAQYVAAIVDSNGDQLYGVFRRSEQDSYGLYQLNSDGSWVSVFEIIAHPTYDIAKITGIAGIDDSGNGGKANRLIATMANREGKRFLVVDPQSLSPGFHEFSSSNGDESYGDDIGANRPAGKALVAGDRLWVARNGLWVLDDIGDLGDESEALRRVKTPANLGSIDYVPAPVDSLILVTLNGDVYRSPVLSGATPTSWEPTDISWNRLGGQSRAFSNVLWVPGADLLLISTITYGGTIRRGYTQARFTDGNTSVSFDEPGGNYRSTELSSAGISRMVRLPGENETLVFALTENNGLWATSSYLNGEVNPDWRWE